MPRYGLFGSGVPRLDDAVRDSPEALAYANDYHANVRRSSRLQFGAIALYLLGAADPFDLFSGEVQIGLGAGAVGLSAAGLSSALRARRSLDDAVETYNAGLPR